MNPLLIIKLKKLLASLTILLNLIAGHLPSKGTFGVATVTGGNNYATSTYNFSDNDVINAGDLNAITDWLGTRNSTDTKSVAYNAFRTPLNTASNTVDTQILFGKLGGATSSALFTFSTSTAVLAVPSSTFSGQVTFNGSSTFAVSSTFRGLVDFTNATTTGLFNNLVYAVVTSTLDWSTSTTATWLPITSTTAGFASPSSTLIFPIISRASLTWTVTEQDTTASVIRESYDFTVDGVRQGGTSFGLSSCSTISSQTQTACSMQFMTKQLSATSHTFAVQINKAAGAGSVILNGADPFWTFTVAEQSN